MLSIKKQAIHYDPNHDILNYKISDTSNSYGDEDIEDIIVLRDFKTDEITGYTIMNIHSIAKENSQARSFLEGLFDLAIIKPPSEMGERAKR